MVHEGKAWMGVAHLDRRSFLKSGGSLVVAFALPMVSATAADFAPVPASELDSWIAIAEDGQVTAFTGRIDIGTGTQTVYCQAIAEELDIPVESVSVVMGDTARTPEQGKSTASNSVSLNLKPMRQAAAEARGVLLDLAAEKLDVPRDRLSTADGAVFVKGQPNRKATYGELIGGRRFLRKLAIKGQGLNTDIIGKEPLKARGDFTVIGKPVQRVDIPAKVRGEFKFVHDVTVDGMVHGAVVLPPAVGARLVSIEPPREPIPGLIKIVAIKNFVGVVAETEQAALAARNSIKAVWSPPDGDVLDDIYDVIRNRTIVKDETDCETGNVAEALKEAAVVVEATFHLPMNCHGMMGPSCAIADFRGDSLTLRSGTQWPDGTRKDAAAMMGIPAEKVHLIWVEGAGSYGRLGVDDAAADAALLSREVARPVRVQWQRADEHAWSPLNPGAVITVKAGLDKDGNVSAWQFDDWSASHSTGESGNMVAWRALGSNPNHLRLSGAAETPTYHFVNQKVVSHYTEEIVRGVYMRSVGGIQNVFAIESMMDMLAEKAGVDPVEFRLRHLNDERMKAVLRATADLAKWRPGSQRGNNGALATGRGIAINGGARTTPPDVGQAYTATIVDVDVNKQTGAITVRRVYVGFDAGMIVNPDGLRNQIEGGTIMGISRALKEEVTFSGRSITSSDWRRYPVLRFTEAPDSIEIVTLDNDHPPLGAGEPPNVTPAAAIANAVYAATGARITALPLKPERVRAALKG
jgi:CO/xanthine dehydrogenase Mo-binding subunit